jgi:microcompartment protein CcmL/EutN
MIETKGLTAQFEATDAMLKAANVELIGWEKIVIPRPHDDLVGLGKFLTTKSAPAK